MYELRPVPHKPEDLPGYLQKELREIARMLRQLQCISARFSVQNVAPAKAVDGDVGFFAAGVVGASRGMYEYTGGAWVKL